MARSAASGGSTDAGYHFQCLFRNWAALNRAHTADRAYTLPEPPQISSKVSSVDDQGRDPFEPFSDLPIQEMASAHKSLKRLERRDWWMWWSAVTVILLLTLTVIFLSLPTFLTGSNRYFQLNLDLAVHALVALVLLFNVYTVYQQWLIKRLRTQTAQHVQMLERLKIRAEEFHQMATRDPLTGLFNRRFAEERLAGEVARSRRYGHPLTILLTDLNHFKEINDQFGHAAGDLVIRSFAEHLSRVIRTTDLAVRMGGDEFMVLLPECPAQFVHSFLSRLGVIVVDFHGQKIAVTYSVGWAGYQKGETPEQMVERADQALYADKRSRQAVGPSLLT